MPRRSATASRTASAALAAVSFARFATRDDVLATFDTALRTGSGRETPDDFFADFRFAFDPLFAFDDFRLVALFLADDFFADVLPAEDFFAAGLREDDFLAEVLRAAGRFFDAVDDFFAAVFFFTDFFDAFALADFFDADFFAAGFFFAAPAFDAPAVFFLALPFDELLLLALFFVAITNPPSP